MRPLPVILLILALAPLFDIFVLHAPQLTRILAPILVWSIMALGLTVLTGYSGILNLGTAAFMAIGAYSYGILTCNIYPFQLSWYWAALLSLIIGGLSGVVLGLPTLRLSGDYLAIVTLGFGEIVQDALRNLDTITKGTQGINPLPALASSPYSVHYITLAIITLIVTALFRLERSHIGRSWIAVRDDQLAAQCMGVNTTAIKLQAFAICASLCALAGALWAALLGSTGEPSNYDFQISIMALSMVIIGGLGSLSGALIGALVIGLLNTVALDKFTELLSQLGIGGTSSLILAPSNWKYLVFGLALLLMMRFRSDGLLPANKVGER